MIFVVFKLYYMEPSEKVLGLRWGFFRCVLLQAVASASQPSKGGRGSADSNIQFVGPFKHCKTQSSNENLRGPTFWILSTWRRFLSFCVIICSFTSCCFFNWQWHFLEWAALLGIRHLVKFQGVHEILMDPLVNFKMELKGFKMDQRGSLHVDAQTMRPLYYNYY